MTELQNTNFFQMFSIRKYPLLRECLAEFTGTMILIFFGDGVVAGSLYGSYYAGNVLINLCWGLAVIFGCMFSAGVSGAHLNPAVTISLAFWKGFDWKKVGPYIVSQMLGAFVGAGFVWLAYNDVMNTNMSLIGTNGVSTKTIGGCFYTYPATYAAADGTLTGVSVWGAVWSEIFGTCLLIAGIFAIGDAKNIGSLGKAGPWGVGVLVMAIGMAFGGTTGYAINPARDFGPRCFVAIMLGSSAFTDTENPAFGNNVYWPIPLLATVLGGLIGGFFYTMAIELHHDLDPVNKECCEENASTRSNDSVVANVAFVGRPSLDGNDSKKVSDNVINENLDTVTVAMN